jgi:hypothetical protein
MDALEPVPTSVRGDMQEMLEIRAAGTLLAD